MIVVTHPTGNQTVYAEATRAEYEDDRLMGQQIVLYGAGDQQVGRFSIRQVFSWRVDGGPVVRTGVSTDIPLIQPWRSQVLGGPGEAGGHATGARVPVPPRPATA